MKLIITTRTTAAEVRPGDRIYDAGLDVTQTDTHVVDEVRLLASDQVEIGVRPEGRADGKRRFMRLAGTDVVELLPTPETADELAAIAADAIGTSYVTRHQGEVIETDGSTAAARWRETNEHSKLLNDLGWKMAAALGDVMPGDVEVHASIEQMVDRLITRDTWAGRTLAGRLEDIAVVDALLNEVDMRHPTAIADHLRLKERAAEERRALAEMTPLRRRMAGMTVQEAHERGDREAIDEFERLAAQRDDEAFAAFAKGGDVHVSTTVLGVFVDDAMVEHEEHVSLSLDAVLDEIRKPIADQPDVTVPLTVPWQGELDAVGRDIGDTAMPGVLIPTGADTCPASGRLLDECHDDHVHVFAVAAEADDL